MLRTFQTAGIRGASHYRYHDGRGIMRHHVKVGHGREITYALRGDGRHESDRTRGLT
jgi:hypothetical protein